MPAIIVASSSPAAGRTAVAAGLAMRLAQDGRPVAGARIVVAGAGDPNAADDARTFGALPFPQEGPRSVGAGELAEAAAAAPDGTTTVLEAPRAADVAALAKVADARVILVVRGAPEAWPEAPALGERLLGTVATAVPAGAVEAARATLDRRGLRPLGVLPEDRGLAAPSIGEIAGALGADLLYDSGDIDEVIEHIVIAPVSSDGGRPYFWRFPRKAVVTRVDKPDIILSALNNAGTRCLVLCGRQAPILYVVDRARHEEITILLSHRSTVETMQALEPVYDRTRFQGRFKLDRMTELMALHFDLSGALAAIA